MKIQLDFDNKRITIENNVNLGEFTTKIKKIIPDWKKWELQTKTEIAWNNPIYVKDYSGPWWQHHHPYYVGDILTNSVLTTSDCVGSEVSSHSIDMSEPKGIYQVDLN